MAEASKDFRDEFSAWLHKGLVENFARETEPWAKERVARVMSRLNAARPRLEAKEGVILWMRGISAFTFVGRHVYIARRLLERLSSDEMTAFVLAHEIAHHDCHHFTLYRGWGRWLPRNNAMSYVAALMALLEHNVYGAEKEAEADDYAIRLCMRAGYDGERCLQAFAILENLTLDAGDLDAVFGPENLLDPTDPGQGSMAFKFQKWLWTRGVGYLPLRERRAAVAKVVRSKA